MQILKSIFIITSFWSLIAHCGTRLFYNGKILASSQSVSTPAEWLVQRNGYIVSVGKGKPPGFPYEEKTDLLGRYVMPSLTDSHAHIVDLGRDKFQVDLRGCKSPQDAVSRVQAFLVANVIDNDAVIVGNGWDQSDWPGKVFPTKSVLDGITKKRSIILNRVDGHAIWVNSYALDKADITKNTLDPKGGKIERDSEGKPTGILIDEAISLVDPLLTEDSSLQQERNILAAVNEALSVGITSIHDAGATGDQIEMIRKLLQEKKIRFRFYEMISAKDESTLKKYFKRGPEIDAENGQLTVRGVKLFADGAMGSRGAAFDLPYKDDPKNTGLLITDEKEMTEKIKRLDRAGFQVAVHAIGSKANRITLNAMEAALGKRISDKRPRLEHAQVLSKADIERVGRLGVIASMQPVHCTSDMKWVVDRIGTQRARYAYAWKSLLLAKAHLAFGSDSPVELINPWHGLFAAVRRQDAGLKPTGGFFPEEKISLTEAFDAFTTGAAYAGFFEKTQGELAPGKWADFIVAKKNPFKLPPLELRSFDIDETYVGGEKVWQSPFQPQG